MNTTTYDSDPILTGVEMGVITLGEFLADPQNCRKISAQQRIEEIVQAAQLADEAGLDVIGVGNITASI